MYRNSVNDYCAQHADLARARLEPLYFSGPPGRCDICGQDLSDVHYFGDFEVPGRYQWAYFCAHCIASHRLMFGWGHGQLYQRVNEPDGAWLLVAGFAPPGTD